MDTPWKGHFCDPPKGIVYLNNAGSSQIPVSVAEVGAKSLQLKQHPWESNPCEGSDSEVRELYASLIRAESPNCIAFAPSTGFAMTLASHNILRSGALSRPCRILVTEGEEESNVYPWQTICAHKDSQASLEVVARPALGKDADATWSRTIISQLDCDPTAPPVAVLALSIVHWCDGSLLGVEEVSAHLRSMPADRRPYFILDGTQSIGVMPLDVMQLGVDFVASSVHKWMLSTYGTSIMYLHPRHHLSWQPLDQHERFRLGNLEDEWVESASYGDSHRAGEDYYLTAYMSGGRRINCGGHPSPVNFSMLAASLRLISSWTPEAIQARVRSLTIHLAEEIETAGGGALGLSVLPTVLRSGHIMGIWVDETVAEASLVELNRGLQEAGVLVTVRHGCIRVSPYVNNTFEDITALVNTLRQLIRAAQQRARVRGPKKVMLLLGGSGWLGQQVVSAFNDLEVSEELPSHLLAHSHELHVTYLTCQPYYLPAARCHRLDLSDPTSCKELVACLRPDIVLNTAAMSSPAACQKHPSAADAVNCPTALLTALREHVPTALVLFTSTDLVYAGDQAPYSPTPHDQLPSPPPNNVYGSSKLNAERQVCSISHGLVFRLSNMVGGNYTYSVPPAGGGKFLSWIQRSFETRTTVTLKDDELRSFVLSSDVTTLLLGVCRQYAAGVLPASHPCWGQRVYNVGGPHGLSRMEFARIVAAAQGVDLQVVSRPDRASVNPPPNPLEPSPSPLYPTRDVWEVEAVSSLQMALSMSPNPSGVPPLPPLDVTMDSSLTEAHFGCRFGSIESGMKDCLKKV